MARLLSINVGLPQDIAWHGETVHTAVWKRAVSGRRMARRLNLDGDGQGDLIGHGGEYRAVFVYQIDCYRFWQRELGRDDFTFGQFGENFTVEGMPDDEVCIGDRYRIGSALFEVTQPRVTCYRVGIRMNEPRMAALLTGSGRPGFYFRVLEEGEVEAGEEIIKVTSGAEQMTVARVNALLYLPGHPREELERALRIPALSAGWQNSFQALLEQELSGRRPGGNPGLSPSDISLVAARLAGFPSHAGHVKNAGERRRDFARARAGDGDAARRSAAGPVHCPAPATQARSATAHAQLLALGRAQCSTVPHNH